MEKIKIIHINDSLCVGGREKVVIDICNNLNKEKYSVYLVSLCNDDNELVSRLNPDVTFFCLPFPLIRIDRANTFFSFFDARNELFKLLNIIDPDIVHTHSYFHRLLIIATALKKYKKEIKCFHTVHTSGMYFLFGGIVNFIKISVEKYALSLFKPNLVAISEIIQENNKYFFGGYTIGSRYIPNGIDVNYLKKENFNTSRFDWGILDGDIVLTYVSRLCHGKNHMTLLKAIQVLKQKHPHIKLLLAGDGDLKNELQLFVRSNSLSGNVVFLGSINNVPELLSITDIGTFPSEFEGFPLTLIEMMSMALPIVVSDNEIFKKLVIDGENGLLFPVFDYEKLAFLIDDLIQNENLRTKLSINAEVFANQFSIKHMVFRHENYYENAI